MEELCEVCGVNPVWATHHKDGNHENNDPSNLEKLCEKCHAMKEGRMANLTPLKVMYENYMDARHARIIIEGRLRSLKKQWLIENEGVSESLKAIKKFENSIKKEMITIAKESKVFNEICEVRGMGDLTVAQLMALIGNIKRFNNIRSLWAYAGLAVVDGKAPRPKKGEQLKYNTKLKTLLLGVIGTNFMRSKSPYYQIYLSKKKEYSKREGWTKMHCHRAAIRYVVKDFVKNVWLKWREVEGLEITEPYQAHRGEPRKVIFNPIRFCAPR